VNDVAWELARTCEAAARGGADFPTIWQSILKSHPLVAGLPIQRLEAGRPLLEIPLTLPHRIVHDPGTKRFLVE
jgi:hypothetical protein